MRSARRIQKLLSDLDVSGDNNERERSDELQHQHSEELLDEDTSGGISDDHSRDGDSSKDSRLQLRSDRLAGEMAALEQREGEHMRAVALEAELAKLLEERRLREAEHLRQTTRLENEVARLQQQAERDLAELKQRQLQVEEEAPKLEDQLKAAREELRDLTITSSKYEELRAVPEKERSLRQHVLLLAHERMQRFHHDAQHLIKERDLAREALGRGCIEVERVKREAEMAAAAHARDKADVDREAAAIQARNERLEKDLQEAIVNLEVLTAKGAMYDQMKEKADRWEREGTEATNERLLMATKLQVVDEERSRLQSLLKEKEHTLELLRMDKAYLSKEVVTQGEQRGRLETEVDRQQQKIRELKRARQELYDRLLAEKQDVLSAHEQRLQGEIGRVQARAAQDLESIRRESAEAMEREVRTLREMRDAAAMDSERAHAELKDSKRAYEDLILKYREQQKVADTRQTELWAEVKMKGFELDRLQLLYDETSSLLKQTKLQNEMLSQKVKVLRESYDSLDVEKTKKVAELHADLHLLQERMSHYDMLEKELDNAVMAAAQGAREGEGEGAEEVLGTGSIPVATSEKRRFQHSLELAKRCTRLQGSLSQLQELHAADNAKLAQLQQEAAKAKEQLKHIAQPQSFLLQAIQRTEAERDDAKRIVHQLQAQLRQAEVERDRLKLQLQRMRADMHQFLEERLSVESLRYLLQQQQQQQQAGALLPLESRSQLHVGKDPPPPPPGPPGTSSCVAYDGGPSRSGRDPNVQQHQHQHQHQQRMYQLAARTALLCQGEGKVVTGPSCHPSSGFKGLNNSPFFDQLGLQTLARTQPP